MVEIVSQKLFSDNFAILFEYLKRKLKYKQRKLLYNISREIMRLFFTILANSFETSQLMRYQRIIDYGLFCCLIAVIVSNSDFQKENN